MSQTKVEAGAITNDAVGTTEIANDAVTAAKIATGAVGTTKIASEAVGTTEIANEAVTSDKMGLGSVYILHAANAGESSITLALGSGNYFVEFYYTTHLSFAQNFTMVIDGTNVQTSSAFGDYQGTFYVPMFGAKNNVSGNRTITCSITNGIGFPNATVQRCMVKATRIY